MQAARLGPLALQGVQTDGNEMKVMMQQMMQMMGGLSEDMKSVKSGVDEAKATAQEAVTIATRTEAKLVEMQHNNITKEMVQDMIDKSIEDKTGNLHGAVCQSSSTTLVVGGLRGYSFPACAEWIQQTVSPEEIYKKDGYSEEFKGIALMKFNSFHEAQKALKTLKEHIVKENLKDVSRRLWCDFEGSIETRVCRGFLRALRKQLIEWNFSKTCIEIDEQRFSMKVERKEVVNVRVAGDAFEIDWASEQWAQWEDLQKSGELAMMIAAAEDRLKKSRERTSKGAGKGPGR